MDTRIQSSLSVIENEFYDKLEECFNYSCNEFSINLASRDKILLDESMNIKFIVSSEDKEDEFCSIVFNLSGFFKKRKKKGFVYIGRLDSPIYKDSKGNTWIDGSPEYKPFCECSQRLKDWLSLVIGREANNEDYVSYLSLDEDVNRELNPFDFVYEDIFDVFIRETIQNLYKLKWNWLYYFKRYGKIDTNILQRYLKKLFKGNFNKFSPVVNQDYVNWLDAIDSHRRIFFVNRNGERMRVNSSLMSGVVYDPIGTSEGALINQKNKIPSNAVIENGTFYIKKDNERVITLHDFFSNPVKMLSGKVMQWGVEVQRDPWYEQKEGDCLSVTSMMIPMVNFCDTTRAILSGHMMLQAVPLIRGSRAIIQSLHSIDFSKFYDFSKSKIKYIPSTKGTYNFIHNGVPDTFINNDIKITTPLLTAYMNFFGLEQEDAIVISESAANKLSVHKIKEEVVDIIPSFLTDDIVDVEIYCPSDQFCKIPYGMKKYYRGVGNKVILKKKYIYPAKIGDKITTRYGCKGVISKIVPDNEMPCLCDGRKIEAIQSPLAVLSRKNIAQYYESLLTHALYFGTKKFKSGCLELKGTKINWEDRHNDLGIAHMYINPICQDISPRILSDFVDHCSAQMAYDVYINGRRIKNKIIVGYNEFMRLYFFSEKKFFYYLPYNNKKNHEEFRVDEMSLWALLSHDKLSLINTKEDIRRRNEWINSRLLMSGYVLDVS